LSGTGLFFGRKSLNKEHEIMKIIIRWVALLLAQTLFFSCSSQTVESGNADALAGTVDSDSLPFAVYKSFAGLEPLLHQQNDTTYVVNFWATWCKPCVAELPFFEKLHGAYRDKPVKVILISMDFPKQLKTKLLPFIQARDLQAQVVALADMDYNSWIDKVSREWDGAIPFTLLYRREKRRIIPGELDSYDELTGPVEELMNH